jgi:hypothetical protein
MTLNIKSKGLKLKQPKQKCWSFYSCSKQAVGVGFVKQNLKTNFKTR